MHFRVGASSENPNVNSNRIFFNADLVRPHFALKLQFAAFSLQHCTAASNSSTTGGNEKKMLEHEHVIGQLAIPLPTSLVEIPFICIFLVCNGHPVTWFSRVKVTWKWKSYTSMKEEGNQNWFWFWIHRCTIKTSTWHMRYSMLPFMCSFRSGGPPLASRFSKSFFLTSLSFNGVKIFQWILLPWLVMDSRRRFICSNHVLMMIASM